MEDMGEGIMEDMDTNLVVFFIVLMVRIQKS